ncbi:MAG: hypothetical protein AMJ90_09105 [candidate division Zixibacteria bacterium SM23_73_2]|nr:MAG: hypothetical protein AMJ90_09105 [candidate division Zixibacteria bacterium SM23_73_2]
MLRKTLFSISVLVLFFFSLSAADVVYTTKTITSGMMGMGDMETETVTKIKGDKKREESTTKFAGGMMMKMMKVKDQKDLSITRLDKEVVWDIDLEEETYTELTFEQMKKMMEMVKSQVSDEDKEEMEAKTTFDINRTDKKQKIGGYDCEEVLVKMITEGEDPETGEEGKFTVDIQMWITQEVKESGEIEEFNKKMAEKLGMGDYAEKMFGGMAQFGIDTELLSKKAGEIKGFPLKTVVQMKPEMEMEPEDELEEDEEYEEDEEDEEVEEKEDEKYEEEEELSAMQKQMMEKMGISPEGSKGGILFETTTTIEEIKKEKVADSEFDLPEGLSKKKMEMEF